MRFFYVHKHEKMLGISVLVSREYELPQLSYEYCIK